MSENIKFNLNTLTEEKIEEASLIFKDFLRVISTLRNKNGGCPWDLEQDHESIKSCVIEESYEAADAISTKNYENLSEELGDILLQIVFHAQIGIENSEFSIVDVLTKIKDKMIRRHPHVFSDTHAGSSEEVLNRWEKIKSKEKQNEHFEESDLSKFFTHVISSEFPSTKQALLIGKKAHKINFDWDGAVPIFNKLKSEVDEVEEALNNSEYKVSEDVKKELGDLYFSLAQLCRKLKIDPEITACDGNRKFVNRFLKVIELAKKRSISLENQKLEILESLWEEAKEIEKEKNNN